eukprot:CAMPEP_0201740658 /NCGR_PEP_ID=MMETSP0593-20130828/46417_1 /ASSEMBLY_ACC=CAM_ASM_000672 /TAXON_ID=267983 /ORGANISM="Skeletonema japonicum, Strain CCMP2506" /LENGTH=473 /DNA_ID=CAMNT_0048234979 /DNA_START=50 /DNA_END=1471 /DNA_ORIENTATION=+
MEDKLERVNKRLKEARDDLDKHLSKAQDEETRLKEKLHDLNERKRQCACTNGNLDVSDDDLIEINAGGKLIVARRGVLCQFKGTNLETLFCGRWEKKLLRDGSGRVFLDVNPKAFRGIVDWLNMMAILSAEEREDREPSVNVEYKYLLDHQMEIFVRRGDKQDIIEYRGFGADASESHGPESHGLGEKITEAIEKKWAILKEMEKDILSLEENFLKEEQFIEAFVGDGVTSDIVTLNVSGTMMATHRTTLQVVEDSVLAQQFDNTKWTEQNNRPNVIEWTPDEVAQWVKSINDVPEDVSQIFLENKIKGSELFALDKEGLKMLGVERVGTICLLSDEICALKKEANEDVVTLIEHSPYCFGKILDHLRMKHFSAMGLSGNPDLPFVSEDKRDMFETVVRYYFPGESSKLILPERKSPFGFSYGKPAEPPGPRGFSFGGPFGQSAAEPPRSTFGSTPFGNPHAPVPVFLQRPPI